MTTQQAFEIAIQHHQAGRLAEAEAAYRQILSAEPRHAGALHLLGVIAHQVGQHRAAAELIRQAIAAKPDFPEAHCHLGSALQADWQRDAAMASYRQAIALSPTYSDAHYNLANALHENGQLDEAVATYRQAIAIRPNYPEALYNLGNALQAKGRTDEAIASFQQAIALKPGFPEAHCNLGNALKDKGRLDAAIASYRQALACKPDLTESLSNLGNVLRDKEQLDEAILCCRQAIALRPNYAEAYGNLGNALKDKGQLQEAIVAYRQAIALKPDFAEAYNNLGNALKDRGQLDEAITAYRKAIALRPHYPEAHSNLLFVLNYHPACDAQTLAEEHRRWNRVHAEALRQCIRPHSNDRTPGHRLRLGYVPPDARAHPVWRFLLPLLARHDPASFEIFCYTSAAASDVADGQPGAEAIHWHSLIGLSDDEAAELIRHHQIEILVDLSGHAAHNRLLVFARKPAPVQVTFLGYPNTTGLATMDYRLTDAHADPPGMTESFHTEQLVRLSPSAWCYQPGHSAKVGLRLDGPITFGCFNNFAKVTEQMLLLWARILQGVPQSRLLLKALGLGDESARQRVRQTLGKMGIAPECLELRGNEPLHHAHLALYHRVDIALDTYPYHGTTTTCEALWMGVPVITLAGKTHASRVGASLLNNVGLPDLVATTPEDYVQRAIALATDPPRLAGLRQDMRPRMQASSLMDAALFTRNVEAAYRKMWRAWCVKE